MYPRARPLNISADPNNADHKIAADAVSALTAPAVIVFEPEDGNPRLIVSRLDAGPAAALLERAAAELRLAEAAEKVPEPEPPGPSIAPPGEGEESFSLGED